MIKFINISFLSAMDWSVIDGIPEVERFLRIVLIIFISFFVISILGFALGRIFDRPESKHIASIIRKFVNYLGYLIILLMILSELGVDLTALIATAGIATVAIGFAAQTSLSNLISGLFLIGEKPFKIGDLVRVGTTLGVIESIDSLSIKLRTLDNLFIRIPNEEMIKNQVTNVTRYPLRRMDIEIGVAYKEDVDRVMKLFSEIIEANHYAMDEPEPLILFDKFGDSALIFKVGIWFEKSNYRDLRNSFMRDVKRRFDEEGVEIPFPHLTLYSGSATEPFPIQNHPPKTEQD